MARVVIVIIFQRFDMYEIPSSVQSVSAEIYKFVNHSFGSRGYSSKYAAITRP